MSKVPPQLGELFFALVQRPCPLAFRHVRLQGVRFTTRAVTHQWRTARIAVVRRGKIAPRPRLLYPALVAAEDLLSTGQDVVERVRKMGCAFGELLVDLVEKFLVALLDLF